MVWSAPLPIFPHMLSCLLPERLRARTRTVPLAGASHSATRARLGSRTPTDPGGAASAARPSDARPPTQCQAALPSQVPVPSSLPLPGASLPPPHPVRPHPSVPPPPPPPPAPPSPLPAIQPTGQLATHFASPSFHLLIICRSCSGIFAFSFNCPRSSFVNQPRS